ncbi:MAG: hypothetical protein JW874_13675, partial [Spirochaetales bacterium]|nr:hypothetical protein [Spirochaetales bacterium]
MMTDEFADIVMQAAYTAFGQMLAQTGNGKTNYLYTGQEYDSGTGLYYYGARCYDP